MALETGWTQIQHEQYLASKNIPKSTLVPLTDTGDAYDIHPQDKHIVGHRVAQQIIRLAYNEHLTIGPM